MGQLLTEADAKDFLKSIYDSAYRDHAGAVQESLLTEDIGICESEVLGYIRQSYDNADEISETTAPQSWRLLRGLVQSLLLRRAYMRFDYAGVPEGVENGAKDATFRLLDIGKGKLRLPDVTQQPKSQGLTVCFGSRPSFSRSAMRGF